MNGILISKEEILELLSKCFEEGYGGYLELKDDFINSALEDYLKSKNLVSNYRSTELTLPNYPQTETYLLGHYGDASIVGPITISSTQTYENVTLTNYEN